MKERILEIPVSPIVQPLGGSELNKSKTIVNSYTFSRNPMLVTDHVVHASVCASCSFKVQTKSKTNDFWFQMLI